MAVRAAQSGVGRLGCGFLLCGATLLSGNVRAADGEFRTGGMVGAVASTRLQISPLAGLSAGWGLSEELEFSVEGLGTLPIASERYSLLQIYPGLSYKLDVLRIVPRISVGAGYAGALGDNTAHGALLLVGGGVNYLWDRTTQLGLGYAFSVIPGALGSGEEGALRVLQVPTHQIRLSLDYHWGY